MRNWLDIEDDQISKVGDSGLTDLAGFLLKLEKADEHGSSKVRAYFKESSEKPK